MGLVITLKKSSNCWLAKFSDESVQEFLPTAYTEKASLEKVIAELTTVPANEGATFIVDD